MSPPVKPSSCRDASRTDDLMLVLLHHDHSWRNMQHAHTHTDPRTHTETHIPTLQPRHYAPLTPRFQAGAAVVCRSIWQRSPGLQHFGASVSAWYEQLRVPCGTLQAQMCCSSTRFLNLNGESIYVLCLLMTVYTWQNSFLNYIQYLCVCLCVCICLWNCILLWTGCECTYSVCGPSCGSPTAPRCERKQCVSSRFFSRMSHTFCNILRVCCWLEKSAFYTLTNQSEGVRARREYWYTYICN